MNINHNSHNNFLKEIIAASKESSFKEICGFVYFDGEFKFQKATNFATDMDFFEIHPFEFLNFKKNKNLVAIFHSHIDCDEKISQVDIDSCENCLYPYLIFSTKTNKFSFYYKEDFEPSKELIKKLEECIYDY